MREGEADEGFVWKRWRRPGGERRSRPSERIEAVAWIGLIIRMGPIRGVNGNCLKKHPGSQKLGRFSRESLEV
jgi:hypothetical protein